MYINRVLLLLVGILIIFYPTIEGWIMATDTVWYRPYQLWLVVILSSYWNQRSRYPDEL
mgnify:CR=1 FL=1